MNEVYEFFQRLTDRSDWPPRWLCGRWTDFHGWLYILSDVTIWLAYMAIPLILIRFIFVKKGVPLSGVFVLFGAFILLFGLTHLLDAVMFWWPAYRINALIRLVTAGGSIATVLALVRHFDEAIGLRTSAEYDRELAFRQQAMQELSRSNEELQQFAYIASHDLQSPLKTIVNYLSLLEIRHQKQLDPEALKLINVSTAAAERMRILINDLLDFSRVGYERVFQIFQRLHGRNEYPGTGIGLATCKKVVDIYGGQIGVDSTVGVGTTFFVVIPRIIKTSQHYAQAHSLYSTT